MRYPSGTGHKLFFLFRVVGRNLKILCQWYSILKFLLVNDWSGRISFLRRIFQEEASSIHSQSSFQGTLADNEFPITFVDLSFGHQPWYQNHGVTLFDLLILHFLVIIWPFSVDPCCLRELALDDLGLSMNSPSPQTVILDLSSVNLPSGVL